MSKQIQTINLSSYTYKQLDETCDAFCLMEHKLYTPILWDLYQALVAEMRYREDSLRV
jgi:hypothetical protein